MLSCDSRHASHALIDLPSTNPCLPYTGATCCKRYDCAESNAAQARITRRNFSQIFQLWVCSESLCVCAPGRVCARACHYFYSFSFVFICLGHSERVCSPLDFLVYVVVTMRVRASPCQVQTIGDNELTDCGLFQQRQEEAVFTR